MKSRTLSPAWNLPIAAALCGIALPGLAQSNTWTTTAGAMSSPRDAHTALAMNGGVYLLGGRTNASGSTTYTAETFNPMNSLFTSISGGMVYDRSFFPAVPLGTTGYVLIAGGYSSYYGTIPVAELFNTATSTWTSTGQMHSARELFTGTELPNGQVLVAGGFSNGAILGTAELYDPNTGVFTNTATMANTRHGQTATLLTSGPNSGKVLITGGRTANNISLNSAETYTPAGTGVSASWSHGTAASNNLQVDRFRHTATVLADGRILITGGYSSSLGNTVASAETYDPATGAFTLLPATMSESRMDHSATLLNDGRVLIVGGWNSYKSSTVASVDIFDPVTNAFSQAAPLPVTRHEHTATLLSNGTVLVTGGLRWEPSPTIHQTLNDAYYFTPPTSPDFTVAVTPSSQTINAGATASYTVSAAATGGFNGAVTWTVSGAPNGATSTFNPTSGNSALSIVTPSTTAAGTYALTITGTSGSLTRTAAATLVVNVPNFTLSAASSTVTVSPASSSTDSVTVTASGGFSSDVSFSVTGLPGGATASFAPPTVTGAGSSVMTIAADSTTVPGTYAITLVGTSGGLTHSLALSLVVAAPGFGLSVSPSSRSVSRGYSTTYGITITRTGSSTEAVNLGVTGLPAGVTASFSANPATSTSTMTVRTTTSAVRATYKLTITGTGAMSGVKHTAAVTLTITR